MVNKNIIIENGILKQYIPNESEVQIIIPESVKEIGFRPFLERVIHDGIICVRKNYTVKSIVIPNSVQNFHKSIFDGLESLTEVEILGKKYNYKDFDCKAFFVTSKKTKIE